MTITRSTNGTRIGRGLLILIGLVLVGVVTYGILPARVFAPPTLSSQVYGMMTPSVRQDDLDLMRDTLLLDEFQQEITTTFYNAYREEFNTAATSQRERKRGIISEMKGKTGEEMSRITARSLELDQQWRRESRILETGFFTEVQGLLTEDQQDRWPIFERDRRRQRLIAGRSGRYEGEHVDLVILTQKLKLPPAQREKVDPLLEQYVVALDTAILQRERAQEAMTEAEERQRMSRGERRNLERFERDLHEAHIEICHTNEQFSDRIIAALETPWSGKFKQAWLARAFRSIFTPTRADRYIERVLKIDDLTESQQTGAVQIQSDYHRQREPINAELMEVMRKQRDRFQTSFFNIPPGPSEGGDGGWTDLGAMRPDPVLSSAGRSHTELWRARNDLDQEIMSRLQDVLTEEQRRLVPSRFGPRQGGKPRPGASPKPNRKKSGDR